MPRGYGGGLQVTISGVEWPAAAAALRHADRDIKRQFSRDISRISRPIVAAMKASVLGTNSKGKGTGLRARVAASVRVSRGAKMGIKIFSSPRGVDGRLAMHMDAGYWKHPVFGTEKWVQQETTPDGWFTKTARSSAPAAIRGVEDSITTALNKIAARVDAAG